MSFTIRKFKNEDAASVADIYNASIDEGDATFDEVHWDSENVTAMVENYGDKECLLVLDDAGIKGFGIVKKYSDRPGYRLTCETAVYLKRDEVGKGYGTALKQEIIDECKELGHHHLVAKIFSDNERSIKYNEKLGYEVVGRQKEVGVKNGKWVDITIMQLILDNENK